MSTPEGLPQADPWADAPISISWDVEPPATIRGQVVSSEWAKQLDIKTGKPLTWDDGRPRLKIVVLLRTEEGEKQLHVKKPGGLFAAIMAAIKEAGASTLVPGWFLNVTYTGNKPPEKAGLSPTKEYAALLENPEEPPF